MIREIIEPSGFIILFFALTIGLTILIETPIIVRGGVTDNKAYIRGVNIVTNVALNLSLAGTLFLKPAVGSTGAETVRLVWFILAEAAVIPVSEALAYQKISGAGTKRIFLFTYLANFASCTAGLLLDALLRYIVE